MRAAVLCLLLAVPSWAAIAYVQDDGGNGSNSTSCATSQAANITAGNFLVATVRTNSTTATVSSIDGCTATWTQAVRSATNRSSDIWYCTNATGGSAAVTVTLDTKVTSACNVAEFSGVATSSVVDQTGTNNGSSTTPTTATITTTNADDLLIGSASTAAAFSSGPTNSFNALTTNNNAIFLAAYRIVSSTGSYSTSWTTGNATWDTTIASFKAAAAGGTVVKDVIRRGIIAAPR